MKIPRKIGFAFLAATMAASFVSACSSDSLLPDAGFTNVVDTVHLYALRGTAVTLPSGYDIPNRTVARTDITPITFDFAFDIDTTGQAVVMPPGALRLTREPGIHKSTLPFDSIIEAPESGYTDSLAVGIDVGTVFVVRSRFFLTGCDLGGSVPRYGKFRVLEIDPAIRRLKLEVLANQNCGYRGLQPGNPPN